MCRQGLVVQCIVLRVTWRWIQSRAERQREISRLLLEAFSATKTQALRTALAPPEQSLTMHGEQCPQGLAWPPEA